MNFEEIKEKAQSFADTCIRIFIHPRTFFYHSDKYEPWDQVIFFNIICGVLAGIIKMILTFGNVYSVIVIYPVVLLIITFCGGAMLFICFKLFGGEGEFEPTVKMVGYTQAVSILSYGIPAIGPLFALYQLALLALLGEAEHKLNTRSAFIAVSIPIALYLVLAALLATILGVSFFGGIISHTGQTF